MSEPGTPTTDLFDLPREELSPRYERLRHGGGGPETTMICGAVTFEHPAARELSAPRGPARRYKPSLGRIRNFCPVACLP